MTRFAKEPNTFETPREAFEFFATRTNQEVRAEVDDTTDEEGMPVFGFMLIDMVKAVRYFNQNETTVLYFDGGGALQIDAAIIQRGLRVMRRLSGYEERLSVEHLIAGTP